jgi:hypothetical protein
VSDYTITEFVWPPTPMPGFWMAYDDNLGADDSPYGQGATEQEAIDDLRGKMEDVK